MSKFPKESFRSDKWLLPNWISYFRILFAWAPACLLVIDFRDETLRWWATGVFVFLAVTDWVDGFVARRWNMRSKWGEYVDPFGDKILVVTSLLALGVLYFDHPLWWVLAVSVTLIVLREAVLFVQMNRRYELAQPPTMTGKVKTVFQMTMIAAWMAPFHGAVAAGFILVTTVLALIWTFASWRSYYKAFVAGVPVLKV